MREIVFDTETTGLKPEDDHRVIEIGCVEMVNRVRTGKHFHVYINPERDVPQDAVRVHGITAGFLADKPLFEEIADEFVEFVGDARLVAHNAGFDIKFINYELKKLKRHITYDLAGVVDTLKIARKQFPGSKANLDALCSRFGVDTSRREKHGALLDAELLAEVYIHLTGGYQGSLALDKTKEQNKVQEAYIKRSLKALKKRTFPVSEQELQSHKAFLEKIPEAMWSQ